MNPESYELIRPVSIPGYVEGLKKIKTFLSLLDLESMPWFQGTDFTISHSLPLRLLHNDSFRYVHV